MLQIQIPEFGILRLSHLVLDYNGTLACDGELLPRVRDSLDRLAQQLAVHVLTADTFGTAQSRLAGVPCELSILGPERQAQAKRSYVEQLGVRTTACIGNGRNDRLMLETAALGIVVAQQEGACVETLLAADLIVPNICAALDLLGYPQRLVATLRG